ncbi:MAG: hypothetical protein ACRC10_07385 [Thermoguttaceae bacterium]
MERVWYIIVDQEGERIRTDCEREAKTAFRSGGIVTIVHETIMYVGETMVSTRVFVDM